VERVEYSPIFRPLIVILKTPLHHFHIVPYDFSSLDRIITFKLRFIIYSDEIFISFILSRINHVSLELETLFDAFLINHPMWVGEFVNLLRPIIPEYTHLIVTEVAKENLCSSPVHEASVGYVAVQIIGECRLINPKNSVKKATENIKTRLFRQKVVAKEEY
jgi:hypothetical protein